MAEKKNSGFPADDNDLEKGPLLGSSADDKPKPQPSHEANRVFLGIPVQVSCHVWCYSAIRFWLGQCAVFGLSFILSGLSGAHLLMHRVEIVDHRWSMLLHR